MWSIIIENYFLHLMCFYVCFLYSKWPLILAVYQQMEKKKQENKMRRDQLNDEYLELLEKQRLYFKTVKEFKEVRTFFASVSWRILELSRSHLRSSAQIHWLLWSKLSTLLSVKSTFLNIWVCLSFFLLSTFSFWWLSGVKSQRVRIGLWGSWQSHLWNEFYIIA